MLVLTGVAVVVGLAVGVFRGGSWRAIARNRIFWWPALLVGAALPAAVDMVDPPGASALQLAGLALLAGVAARNLMLRGMGVVLVGLTLNLAVVAANTTMPVRLGALIDAGIIEADDGADIVLRGPRHLEDDDTRLALLGDIIPFPLTREVTSFGDLILIIGLGAVLSHLPRPRRRWRGSGDPFAELSDERAEVIDLRGSTGLEDAYFDDNLPPADPPGPGPSSERPESELVGR
ncbi:MAG: DUF5317 domain-containing protein [Actinomycetia bacterium]|nr:DUF5317 domain-containing protein [Actinomycetes bacterium]